MRRGSLLEDRGKVAELTHFAMAGGDGTVNLAVNRS